MSLLHAVLSRMRREADLSAKRDRALRVEQARLDAAEIDRKARLARYEAFRDQRKRG